MISLLAVFISISRVNDHRHDVVDVAGGALIGTVLGIMAAKSINFTEGKNGKSATKKEYVKEKRPSQMRLIHPEFSYG